LAHYTKKHDAAFGDDRGRLRDGSHLLAFFDLGIVTSRSVRIWAPNLREFESDEGGNGTAAREISGAGRRRLARRNASGQRCRQAGGP